jgi:hypothetical protein
MMFNWFFNSGIRLHPISWIGALLAVLVQFGNLSYLMFKFGIGPTLTGIGWGSVTLAGIIGALAGAEYLVGKAGKKPAAGKTLAVLAGTAYAAAALAAGLAVVFLSVLLAIQLARLPDGEALTALNATASVLVIVAVLVLIALVPLALLLRRRSKPPPGPSA